MIFNVVLIILATLRNFLPKKQQVAIIAPAPAGSLGDQALMQGLVELAIKNNCTFSEVLVYPNNAPQTVISKTQGDVINVVNSRLSICSTFLKIIRFKSLYIIGADTLDGGYDYKKNITWFRLANLSTKVGIPTKIVSFSFSASPHPEVVKGIRTLNPAVEFRCRDPESRIRFESATGKRATQAADLAFSMKPYTDSIYVKTCVNWIKTKKQNGSIVVAVNVNYLGMDKNALINAFSESIIHTLQSYGELKLIFVPHDFRQGQSDYKVMCEIQQKLPPDLQARTLMAEGPYEAWDAKFMVKECDFVVTGRMHLAIAALSQAVPVYGFAYKNKFTGLMSLLGLENNLMSRDQTTSKAKLISFFEYAVTNYNSQSFQLKSNLPKLKMLSGKNLISSDVN